VEYWLPRDLVNDDCSAVRLMTPFEDSGMTSPLLAGVDACMGYRQRAMDFVAARSVRIDNLDL
jgi:hypothetical protein